MMFVVGLNPALCGIDLCITQLALGFALTFGSTVVQFYGNVEVPQIQNIFIDAGVNDPNGLSLNFQNVAYAYNQIVGTRLPHLNPGEFPAGWAMQKLNFFLAPQAGSFDGINYNA